MAIGDPLGIVPQFPTQSPTGPQPAASQQFFPAPVAEPPIEWNPYEPSQPMLPRGGFDNPQGLLGLLERVLTRMDDQWGNWRQRPWLPPAPNQPPVAQPMYGVIANPQPPVAQPMYGVIANPQPPVAQPMYAVVFNPNPIAAQPLYAAVAGNPNPIASQAMYAAVFNAGA